MTNENGHVSGLLRSKGASVVNVNPPCSLKCASKPVVAKAISPPNLISWFGVLKSKPGVWFATGQQIADYVRPNMK
jgi:hypothetical protein